MLTAYNDLTEFHDAACIKRTGQRRPNFAHLDIQEKVSILELRQNLVKEEAEEFDEALDEYIDALASTDNIDVARAHLIKEACDVLYVVLGSMVDLDVDLPRAFSRIHANNMLKIKTSELRDDGKLIKPKNHPQVDLKGF